LREEIPLKLSLICLAVFVFAFVTGYLADGAYSSKTVSLIGEQLSFVVNLPPPMLTAAIFANNLVKTMAAMLLGVLLGLPSLLFIWVNGFILGLIGFEAVQRKGIIYLMAGVTPHGVFELPAAILSAALGLKLGALTLARLRGVREPLKPHLSLCFKTYFTVIAPLLAFAAVVEVYVTPLILSLL